MFTEHSLVVLTHDRTADGLHSGDVGAVVHAYPGGKAYEAEFVDGRWIDRRALDAGAERCSADPTWRNVARTEAKRGDELIHRSAVAEDGFLQPGAAGVLQTFEFREHRGALLLNAQALVGNLAFVTPDGRRLCGEQV